jgi:hypothetical protein
MRDEEPPAGYVQLTVGTARVVCAEHLVDSLKAALAAGTLYDYASRHPQARALAGRGTAYSVPLPAIPIASWFDTIGTAARWHR